MKSTFIINENQTKEEIFIKTPNRDGTMVIQDDVLTFAYKKDFVPVYRDCSDGNQRIVQSSLELIPSENDEIGESDGYIFHTAQTDVEVSFKDRNSTKQIMPAGDGYILNSSSVVDCGEIEMVNGKPKLTEQNNGKTSKELEE